MFDNVALLAGGPEVLEARPVRAFDEGVLNLLSDVSARLLKDPEACVARRRFVCVLVPQGKPRKACSRLFRRLS